MQTISHRSTTALRLGALGLTALLASCMAQIGDPTNNVGLVGADEVGGSAAALSTSYPVGTILRTTANLNLRRGPSTGYHILLVMPLGVHVTLRQRSPSHGWYDVKYGSTTGWAYGRYLAFVRRPSSSTSTSTSSTSTTSTSTTSTSTTGPDAAIARAREGVGFSYYWGHGSWRSAGPTSSTRGSCYGNCPSCSHYGRYGADCSGFVAKAWRVPSTNAPLRNDWHPYSTYNFYYETTHWRRVSRSAMHKADALVYHHNGAGHIALYQRGDPWGSVWVYEARGCIYGIQHNLRPFSSAYRAIRRSGY